jgi:ABC-type xylose transport system permease subunit
LQDATFGSATMGWLDLAAGALLGVVARARLRAAVVTGVAAGAWGLLLLVTTTVPATVPTLAGLLVGRL